MWLTYNFVLILIVRLSVFSYTFYEEDEPEIAQSDNNQSTDAFLSQFLGSKTTSKKTSNSDQLTFYYYDDDYNYEYELRDDDNYEDQVPSTITTDYDYNYEYENQDYEDQVVSSTTTATEQNADQNERESKLSKSSIGDFTVGFGLGQIKFVMLLI